MNVAQFTINERFTLSLSDLGKERGFEPMLIDHQAKEGWDTHIELRDSFHKVFTVDALQFIIEEAKDVANKRIKKELLLENKHLFID